jgi:hypothetical protein
MVEEVTDKSQLINRPKMPISSLRPRSTKQENLKPIHNNEKLLLALNVDPH